MRGHVSCLHPLLVVAAQKRRQDADARSHLAHSSSVLGTWSKEDVAHRMASSVPLSITASKLSDVMWGMCLHEWRESACRHGVLAGIYAIMPRSAVPTI